MNTQKRNTVSSRSKAKAKPETPAEDDGWGVLDLDEDSGAIPPGQYPGTVANTRFVTSKDGSTRWLFIGLEVVTEDGEVCEIEDPFIVVDARTAEAKTKRIEGLRRMMKWSEATGVAMNKRSVEDIAEDLIGTRVLAVVARKGSGALAVNALRAVKPLPADV